jgi:hypothetical protein
VYFLLSHQLAVVVANTAPSMVLEIQKMVAVVVVVVTETLAELEQPTKGLVEEAALLLQTAILVVVAVVHLPLVAMRRGKMAAMAVQELTHQ